MNANAIEQVRRALTLIAASAHGAANEGGDGGHFNLFLAIGGAADDALKALDEADDAPACIGAE